MFITKTFITKTFRHQQNLGLSAACSMAFLVSYKDAWRKFI